jgi:hypothetical protein
MFHQMYMYISHVHRQAGKIPDSLKFQNSCMKISVCVCIARVPCMHEETGEEVCPWLGAWLFHFATYIPRYFLGIS